MLLRGMLGIREDASFGTMRLAPQLPPDWQFLHLKNVRWQTAVFDLDLERQADAASVRITPRTGSVALELELPLPVGAEWQPSRGSPFRKMEGIDQSRGVWVQASIVTGKPLTVTVRYRPGLSLVPLHEPMQAGDDSRRLRIIDAKFVNGAYTLHVQGLRGRTYTLLLDTRLPVSAVDGGRETKREAGKRVVEIVFPPPDTPGIEWMERDLTIRTANGGRTARSAR
jgi:hypothetical protein